MNIGLHDGNHFETNFLMVWYHIPNKIFLGVKMNKTAKLFLALSISLTFCSSSFSEEIFRIAGEEWQPYSSSELKYFGLMNRIITESFAFENIKVEYDFLPGARALLVVKNGEMDGTPGWSPSDERAKEFYFSDPLFDETLVFFHLKTKPFDWNGFNDLKGLLIGTVNGSYYGNEFDKAKKEKKLIVEEVTSDIQNFKKILYDRIDIVPKNLDAGLNLLHTDFKPEERALITYHPTPLDQGPLVMLFSKKLDKSKRMLELFNKGLKKLKRNGKYDQFFKESRNGNYI